LGGKIIVKKNIISLDKIKDKKFFSLFDVILYFNILLIAVSSIFLTRLGKSNATTGVEISVDNITICYVDYDSNDIKYYNTNAVFDVEKTTTNYVITIYHQDNKTEYTKIKVDFNEDYALVLSSTCKNHTCKHTGKLTDNGAIICLPYKVKITPSDTGKIVIGG
jgi:hypothetical protein